MRASKTVWSEATEACLALATMKAKRSEPTHDIGGRQIGKDLLVEQMSEGQDGLRREEETKIDSHVSVLSRGRGWQPPLRLWKLLERRASEKNS